jgi:hypothetical protein
MDYAPVPGKSAKEEFAEIFAAFGSNRSWAAEAVREELDASRCSLTVADSISVKSLGPKAIEFTVTGQAPVPPGVTIYHIEGKSFDLRDTPRFGFCVNSPYTLKFTFKDIEHTGKVSVTTAAGKTDLVVS